MGQRHDGIVYQTLPRKRDQAGLRSHLVRSLNLATPKCDRRRRFRRPRRVQAWVDGGNLDTLKYKWNPCVLGSRRRNHHNLWRDGEGGRAEVMYGDVHLRVCFLGRPAPPSGLRSDRTAEHSQRRSCLTSAECSPFTSDSPPPRFNLTRSPNGSPSPITRSFKVARQQPLIRAAHRLCLFRGFIQM